MKRKTILSAGLVFLAAAFVIFISFNILSSASGHKESQRGKSKEPRAEEKLKVVLSSDTNSSKEAMLPGGDNRSEYLKTLTRNWKTNWNCRTIEYSELKHGGPPRDGIPSIDNPEFISYEEAGQWLKNNEPVIALEVRGDARAYPLQILIWHEIVNDTVGGVPVLVTFCPLCNASIVFDRRVNGTVYEFGTSGLLRNSDLVMYDRVTESLWQQLTGTGIVGDHAGTKLRFLLSTVVSFGEFKQQYAKGMVLSRNTGYTRAYGRNPYVGYDRIDQNPFLFDGELDGRLNAMERVVTVTLTIEGEEIDIAYPYSLLAQKSIVNDERNGIFLVVFFSEGTSSALDAPIIAEGRDIGATGVFSPVVNGKVLTFKMKGNRIVDTQTGSSWNIFGRAVKGTLKGETLTPIIHGNHFWFAWAAFKPDTIVYQSG